MGVVEKLDKALAMVEKCFSDSRKLLVKKNAKIAVATNIFKRQIEVGSIVRDDNAGVGEVHKAAKEMLKLAEEGYKKMPE